MIRKILILFLCFLFFININVCLSYADTEKDYDTQMKQDLLVLMLAYPDFIVDIETNENSKVYIIMSSGKKILYDDKLEKTPEEKLQNPDLQDMLEDKYPLEKLDIIPNKDSNPGRIRHYELFNEVYGNSKQKIESNLTGLKAVYPSYQFNKNNNASVSLENALKECVALSKGNSKISNILYPASGTFNYRIISGTGRLSPHSYGIAIDLKSDKRDYWKWSSKEKGEIRLSEYPPELVKAFEDNNFIWGGKWGYFDILHFEYRPEIILKAKYFNDYKNGNDWYEGAPIDDDNVKKCIEIINNSINT